MPGRGSPLPLLLAAHIADAGWRFYGVREIFLFDPEGQVDEVDQYRHLDERSDYCGKCLSGVNAENCDRYCYRKLEVI